MTYRIMETTTTLLSTGKRDAGIVGGFTNLLPMVF
jgi:hypothetical protein